MIVEKDREEVACEILNRLARTETLLFKLNILFLFSTVFVGNRLNLVMIVYH
jgi:hypothetical protein